jgi:hypothetical protein
MATRRTSASWLSDDMAQALAATCPPLKTADVLRAADSLSDHAPTPGLVVLDGMFRSDVDRVNLRNLIEMLQVLYGVRGESLAERSGTPDDEQPRPDNEHMSGRDHV